MLFAGKLNRKEISCLYMVLMRPIQEYCMQFWFPASKAYWKTEEKIPYTARSKSQTTFNFSKRKYKGINVPPHKVSSGQ